MERKIRENERNIKWLSKNIKRYKFDDFYKYSIEFSLKILRDNISGDGLINAWVYPWNLNSLTLMKIYSGDTDTDYGVLTYKIFSRIIGIIQDLETHSRNFNVSDALPKLMVNQFSYQKDSFLQLYRSSYIYNYNKNNLNMSDIFKDIIGCTNKDAIELFYILYLIYGHKNFPLDYSLSVLEKLYTDEKYNKVLMSFTLNYEELRNKLLSINSSVEELVLKNIHLNAYCFLKKNNKIYITFPHNFLSAYFYGTYFRIIESNSKLRENIGKYLWEDYLFHLLSESKKFEIVKQEKEYIKDKNRLKTPDALAISENKTFLFEMKSTVVPLGLRSNDKINEVDERIGKEAEKIYQMYKQLNNYRNKLFKVGNEKDPLIVYGVIINLELSYINRQKIFEKFFEEYLPNISHEEKINITDHIRIIDLSNLEEILLYDNDVSLMEALFESPYTYYYFKSGSKLKENRQKHFQDFINDLSHKSREKFKTIIEDFKL